MLLIVDYRSAYHGVLERSALKKLWAITSIHDLCIKFPTELGIAIVIRSGSRECYLNFRRNTEPQIINMVLIDIEMLNSSREGQTPEQGIDIEIVDVHKGGKIHKEWMT